MIELINRNLGITNPQYFYRVTEYVTTFGKDKDRNQPFTHHQDFKGSDLLKCRKEAANFYHQRLNGLKSSSYFLPFAAPENFKIGINSAFSIMLYLVEFYSDDNYFEHCLIGEDEQTISQSIEIEKELLSINLNQSIM